MQQHSQDTLAINQYFEGEDLFIIITANLAWPKITSALLPNQKAPNHSNLMI
jgi:hypothetical protein